MRLGTTSYPVPRRFGRSARVMGKNSQIRLTTDRFFAGACLLACVVGCGGQENTTPSNTAAGSLAGDFLTAHNQVRAAVTPPANYPGAWAPLPMLAWSGVVEASAQAWANHLRDATGCAVTHEVGGPYGENIAGGTVVGYPATKAFEAWAVEKSSYVYNSIFDQQTVNVAGHYTQIVWRNTTEVGCAMAQCSTGYLVYVCRYNPPGNVIGKQPY